MEFAMGVAAMADSRARRQRRPKRPVAYLALVAACAVFALGSAFEATRPPAKGMGVWRSGAQFASEGKARDVGPAAP